MFQRSCVSQAEPDATALRLLLACAYFHSAQLRRAQAEFERVVTADPADAWARFALGRTLERQSRHREALGHYRLARSSPSTSTSSTTGWTSA